MRLAESLYGKRYAKDSGKNVFAVSFLVFSRCVLLLQAGAADFLPAEIRSFALSDLRCIVSVYRERARLLLRNRNVGLLSFFYDWDRVFIAEDAV